MSKKELNVNNNRNFNNKSISFILQRTKYNHVYEVYIGVVIKVIQSHSNQISSRCYDFS